MAVDNKETPTGADASSGRRFLVGTNVAVMTVLAVAVVVVFQLIAFHSPRRWDMTSSGINSLSDGTGNLLSSLEQNVRLTSLYFETDREETDQPRYRRAAQDLIDLYEATNRTKVRAEWINPLKDHERFRELKARLRETKTFVDELAAYKERVDSYSDELDTRMRELVSSELDQIAGLASGLGAASAQAPLASVENALGQLSSLLEQTRERIDAVSVADDPQYTLITNELRNLYRRLSESLKNIGDFGTAKSSTAPPPQADFLRGAGGRYADVVAAIEGEITKLQELDPLKFDDLIGQLAPTGNAILVETDEDARVVDFASVWPPTQQGGGGRAGFSQRAFKGEEKLTSAILRATHKEQTAVVFVRYGGASLFLGGFMPGQPPAPYGTMKQQIEDANFVVREWDLKTKDTIPEIDPAPTRTIFVVLKPAQPQRGRMGQPNQDLPFTDSHKQILMDAIGDDGRALFIAGWHPGPFGPIPASYEYNDYLSDTWGIKVDTAALLIETMNIAPGRYQVARRDFVNMDEVDVGQHDIVKGPLSRDLGLPFCAPLELSDTLPEGVSLTPLVTLPRRDGVWGVRNLTRYQEQMQRRDYLTREDGDLEGPFELAVAGTKGDAKIVVVSSRDFATDGVAFARELSMTSRGFAVRARNMGNVPLLLNSLHWLNDNAEFMNIGKPIDAAVLAIAPADVKVVQALTIFLWPLLAVVGGGITWWVRRR